MHHGVGLFSGHTILWETLAHAQHFKALLKTAQGDAVSSKRGKKKSKRHNQRPISSLN